MDAVEISMEVPGRPRSGVSSEGCDEGAVLLLGLLVMVGRADTDGESLGTVDGAGDGCSEGELDVDGDCEGVPEG